jgi:hypothetical protein
MVTDGVALSKHTTSGMPDVDLGGDLKVLDTIWITVGLAPTRPSCDGTCECLCAQRLRDKRPRIPC